MKMLETITLEVADLILFSILTIKIPEDATCILGCVVAAEDGVTPTVSVGAGAKNVGAVKEWIELMFDRPNGDGGIDWLIVRDICLDDEMRLEMTTFDGGCRLAYIVDIEDGVTFTPVEPDPELEWYNTQEYGKRVELDHDTFMTAIGGDTRALVLAECLLVKPFTDALKRKVSALVGEGEKDDTQGKD